MSTTVKVISNCKGSGDYVVVYMDGDIIFEGHSVGPKDLFEIMSATNGMADKITYHELTDEQMENWIEEMYD